MNRKNHSGKISIRTFGGLTVYRNNAPVIISWCSQKARLLLCYLLITSDQWVHHDRLVELLWPGGDHDCSAQNFKTTLSRLRKSLSGAMNSNPVLCQGNAYRLNFESITCDCSTFRSEAVVGIRLMTRGDGAMGRQHLKSAQELYSAEFLPEEPDDPFIGTARKEMAGLYDSIMHYLSQNYTSEERTDFLEMLRGSTHFPSFSQSDRRQDRFS
jgi:two-component SAPR family response regulator